jgi:hypothetical protein
MTRLIKYLPAEFNPLLSNCKTIALGTTKQYRQAEASLGTTDKFDGTLQIMLKNVRMNGAHWNDVYLDFNDLVGVNIFCASYAECDPATLDPSYNSSYIIKDAAAFARIITGFMINEYPREEVVAIREMHGKVDYVDNPCLEGQLSYVDLHQAAMFTKRTRFKPNNEYRIAFYACRNLKGDDFYEGKRIFLNCERFWPSIRKLIEIGPVVPK